MPKDLPELRAILERADGTEEPLDVKAGPDNTLFVNFTPKQPGKHLIHVRKERRPIDGSPFEIMVLPASKKELKAPKVMVAEDKPGKKKPVPVDDEEIILMEEEREVESAPPMEKEEMDHK